MFVIGTAGHVDHGKSTLIKILTGIDPDRLKEEKERQMTIDLGFAWMALPSGEEVGFIDVPGHRDFIENMLAGVGGIDAVLLVIAADEGVMPQTKEHLAILDLLQIKSGLIVLSKIDLLKDEEWKELLKEEIKESISDTIFANVPILEVSAVNGLGIHSLMEAISKMFRKCPPKLDYGRPRLPVDRVFMMKGFGTVVTGTLQDGCLHTGQTVEIIPGKLSSRIRGLQNHNRKVEIANPGSRTAVNLANVDVHQVRRGKIITLPGLYPSTRRMDISVKVLKTAHRGIRHNDQLKIFIGTNQVNGRTRVLGTNEILPGQNGWLQLEFEEEISAFYRDHLIIRRPSPPETIAGGYVIDPYPQKRHRRFSKNVIRFMTVLEHGSAEELLIELATEFGPISSEQLIIRSGINTEEANHLLARLLHKELVSISLVDQPANEISMIISLKKWNQLISEVKNTLIKHYNENPLSIGMQTEKLRRLLQVSLEIWPAVLKKIESQCEIIIKNRIIQLPGYEPQFDERQKEKIKRLLIQIGDSPFSPPPIQELESEFGANLINALIETGDLIKTSEKIVFRKDDYLKMVDEVTLMIKTKGELALADFRDKFQTSRKYALSVLEHLDKIGVTERCGETRILKRY